LRVAERGAVVEKGRARRARGVVVVADGRVTRRRVGGEKRCRTIVPTMVGVAICRLLWSGELSF
jgi:hypothetical protein